MNAIRLHSAVVALMLSFTFFPAPALSQSDEPAPLQLLNSHSLPGAIKGHFDHIVVDVKGNRVFLTPEDYRKVLVVDLQTGKLIQEIPGIERPHSILFRSDLNLLYITDGDDGSVKVFDAATYKLEHRIPLLKDADSIGYDSDTHELYVDNGGGDVGAKYSVLSVIDADKFVKTADLKIDGDTLEAMALDPNRPQLYVNNRDKNEVDVVDRHTRKLIASWPITLGKPAVTMAYDVKHHRLFVGCRNGQLVVLDSDSGKELQALPIAKGVDDTVFDEGSRRLYSAGDGAMSVYQQIDANHYTLLGNVPTGPVGKTAKLVPEIKRMFVAVPKHGTTDPSLLVFAVGGPDSTAAAPSTDKFWPVSAPAAQRLILDTLTEYPFINKLGLHAVPPGKDVSMIIANGNMEKIGKQSSQADFDDTKNEATYIRPVDDGAYYNIKLNMHDASNNRVGILIMEIPYTQAPTPDQAIHIAQRICSELEAKILSLESLFQN